MESYRTPAVQPGQQELGRRTARQLREGSEVHPHHNHHDRLKSDGPPRYQLLPYRRQGFQARPRSNLHPGQTRPAEMELHDLAHCEIILGPFLRGEPGFFGKRASREHVGKTTTVTGRYAHPRAPDREHDSLFERALRSEGFRNKMEAAQPSSLWFSQFRKRVK